jgi:hypothetical protein
MTVALEYGLGHAVPDDAPAAWGGRFIVTQDGHVDLPYDRHDVYHADGVDATAFLALLQATFPLPQLRSVIAAKLKAGEIQTRVDRLHTIFEDDELCVQANTNASAGYLYVAAWQKPADDREVWTAPNGVTVWLEPAAFDPCPDDDGCDDEGWFAESPGQRPPQRYLLRSTVTGDVLDDFVVFPVEPWSPYDAASDRLIRDGYQPPTPTAEELAECEHGLSQQLCAGPGHYPPD